MMLSDESEHSTMHVEDGPIKEAISAAYENMDDEASCCGLACDATQSSSKCTVRFAEFDNKYYDNTSPAQDTNSTWYTKQDYQYFKEEVRRQVLTRRAKYNLVCGQMDPMLRLLHQVYNVLLQVNYVVDFDALCLLKPQLQAELLQLFEGDSHLELIGLEKHIAFEVKRCSFERRQNIQDVVYEVQLERLHGMWTQSQAEEELMESCLNFSQSSGLFAQLLAKAQAVAI